MKENTRGSIERGGKGKIKKGTEREVMGKAKS